MIQHVWGLSLPSGFPEGVLSINNHSTLKTGGSRSMLCLLVPSPRKIFLRQSGSSCDGTFSRFHRHYHHHHHHDHHHHHHHHHQPSSTIINCIKILTAFLSSSSSSVQAMELKIWNHQPQRKLLIPWGPFGQSLLANTSLRQDWVLGIGTHHERYICIYMFLDIKHYLYMCTQKDIHIKIYI